MRCSRGEESIIVIEHAFGEDMFLEQNPATKEAFIAQIRSEGEKTENITVLEYSRDIGEEKEEMRGYMEYASKTRVKGSFLNLSPSLIIEESYLQTFLHSLTFIVEDLIYRLSS